jgi:hypothetical protein
MAWYLATGRSPSRWMSLPTPLTVNYGTSAYTIEFESAMTSTADSQFIIGQTTNSQLNAIYFTTSGRMQVSVANSNIFFTNGSYGLFDGNFHKYRFEHDAGGAWRAYRDDVLFQSSAYSGAATTSTALNALFRGGSTTATSIINIKYLEVTGFGSGSARWDATLSGGTGTVLPTVSGTNDATQSGTWPSDDSEWVFYSTGSLDATIAFTMPQMAVSVSGSVSAPSIAATIAVTMPQMTVAAVAGNAAPGIAAAISFTMPQMQAAAVGSVSAPSVAAVVNFTMPQMVVASVASSVAPNVSATVSVLMPQMTVSATGRSGDGAIIAFTMPQMRIDVIADVPLPQEPERSLYTPDNKRWQNSIFFKNTYR